MEEEDKQPLKEEKSLLQEEKEEAKKAEAAEAEASPAKSGGWGGWGFSSVFSDLQKAAEEISRNAAAVAQTAAKSIADMQNPAEDSEESSKEEEGDTEKESQDGTESQDEHEKQRKAALEKLEKASEDSFLGQGLKVLDSSVENFASGAWQALGSALKGSTDLVHKLENSAVNLAGSIQQGGLPTAAGSAAPSLLETGKAFTSKGMQVLELVGKETLDLLITETGIEVEKNSKPSEQEAEEDQLYEEVGFDRCFYIYGGPEQLENLLYLTLFRFTSALAGQAVNDIIQRTTGRLESLHSEGVHRLSEMCCSAVSQLLMLGKSIISSANNTQVEDVDADVENIDWPEDSVEKAKIIRSKAQAMTGYVEAVSSSFITGISDVAEAYLAAIKGASAESHDVLPQTSIQEKASSFSKHLRDDQNTALGKIQDGLHYLSYVVVSSSMPTA
ncbi:PREDICTED: ZEAMMB73_Zm00001d033932 [Prunus dulcis]|uniref:PREDICTED: ZEAMMB73_Zm00001d033932 n=1 Tax=Prunus dulcis TaxID=3755 RepID=A0A5E4EN16_PRUDU|nr:PREDICTED: ZEAMMB73_Zm00001d033932 [Prunus dulcis]